ncbi:MAG: hypothetical protein FWD61_13750 [Phycisphaerales bacterium]|nr:hypothetical protein [Phycisphaerales bacterium]
MTDSFRKVILSLASLAAIAGTTSLTLAENTPGIVSHINILSDKSEDISSPEAWKKTYIKEGMSDQDKAIAIWKTVTKYRHQAGPPGEGLQDANENNPLGNVHEPFKTFHVYGYGMCCCAASNIEGLARYIGMPARGRSINAHSVPEVWYNDSWHLLDASLTFFLQKPGKDGTPGQGDIASVDEMKADIMAWKKDHPEVANDADRMNFAKDWGWKKGPPLFASANDSPTGKQYQFYSQDGFCRAEAPGKVHGTTNHGFATNLVEYNYKHEDDKSKMTSSPPDPKPAWKVYDYGSLMGYQLNVQLREGEKITRNWFAKEVASGLNPNPKIIAKFLAGDMTSLSLQQDLGDKNPGRVGNGTDEYDALADSKLAQTALQCDNLTINDGKIRITDPAKPATLIVRMPCSYVYLGGDLDTNLAGGSMKTSISLNNGLDWKEIASADKAGEAKTDLKPFIFGKYDYRVKFDFTGAGAGLDALKLVNRFQHSQAPLPVITEGDNKITFAAGDQEGTITVQGNMSSDTKFTDLKQDPEKPVRIQALSIADFHPTVDGSASVKRFAIGNTGQGSATLPITTPGDITRVRTSIHWRARDPNRDTYTITASFDNGQTWKDVGKLAQANPGCSTLLVFSDVPANSRNVQLKFAGTQKNTTCIFDLRVDVDYKEPAGGFRPVKVTYNWEEGDQVDVPIPGYVPPPTAAPVEGAKGKAKGAKKAPPIPTEKHGTPKTDSHIVNSPTDSWTIKCGPKTIAKSFTIELAK